MGRAIVASALVVFAALVLSPAASAQQWAVRDVSRIYFGSSSDDPVPAYYAGEGFADPAVFRASTGLWSIKDLTRAYFGGSSDAAVPADFDGNGSDDIAIFRASSGLWSVRNVTRIYFGGASDTAVSDQGGGDFNGDGSADFAVFRSGSGLWAVNGVTRAYFGASGDLAACNDYDGDGTTEIGIFRASSNFWGVWGLTRFYFGGVGDVPVSADYNGDGTADTGVFRGSQVLWAIRNLTRAYFGSSNDTPVPADYDGDGDAEIATFRGYYSSPMIYRIQHDGQTGTVTVPGVVNLVYPSMGFFMAEASGPYHGIYVNQSTYGPMIGDSVTITGSVATSNGKTMIQSLPSFAINSRNNTPYAPVTIATSAITDEQYEGCLVKVDNLQVTNQNSGSGKWVATGGGNPAAIDYALDYNYFPRNGDQFTSIVGVVERNASQNPNQWLQPRSTDDFTAGSDVIPHFALFGTIVTMDDSNNVHDGYYLEVRGESIESIGPNPPAGVGIIDVDGIIFPGLISTHDHLDYDLWDFIPFAIPPYFTEKNGWADTQLYSDFKAQRTGFSDYYNQITKLAEVRMATSGCTVTQSRGSGITHNQDIYAKLGVGIINGERFPGRVKDVVLFPTSEDWNAHHADAVNGKLHRYMIHLGETTDSGPTMAGQWNWWKTTVAFDGYDTIIHGINIPAADYSLFDHGVDPFGAPLKTVVSWACKSNMLLYNQTANIRGALDAGVTVALAPDWTESGMPNMLAELNYAAYIAKSNAWNIQSQEFVEMVTRNAAAGFGQLYRMGTLETGKMANLMVIPDGAGDPFDDFMMVAGAGASYDYRCGPKDVKLTVVAGRPIYGDPGLLNVANFPSTYGGYIEDLIICGEPKKLSLARYNGGAYTGVNELFGDFYLAMWEKYQMSSKYPCDFLSVDPAGVLPQTVSGKKD